MTTTHNEFMEEVNEESKEPILKFLMNKFPDRKYIKKSRSICVSLDVFDRELITEERPIKIGYFNIPWSVKKVSIEEEICPVYGSRTITIYDTSTISREEVEGLTDQLNGYYGRVDSQIIQIK